jgi:hypothetical protein
VRVESAVVAYALAIGTTPIRFRAGYDVADLDATLKKAASARVTIIAGPCTSDGRRAAMVAFPGGYVAELHSPR